MESLKSLKNFKPTQLSSQDQAYSGYFYVSQSKYRELLKLNGNKEPIYVMMKKFVFILSQTSNLGDDGCLSLGSIQRQFLGISKTDLVDLTLYTLPYSNDKEYRLSQLSLEVEVYQAAGTQKIEAEDKEFDSVIRKSLKNIFFTPGQLNLLDYNGSAFLLKVVKTQLLDMGSVKQTDIVNQPGILVDETDVELTAKPNPQFKLKSSKGNAVNIFRPDFEFKEMGIGGLDKELMNIFRRAFSTRRFPPSVLAKYGITHVKG